LRWKRGEREGLGDERKGRWRSRESKLTFVCFHALCVKPYAKSVLKRIVCKKR